MRDVFELIFIKIRLTKQVDVLDFFFTINLHKKDQVLLEQVQKIFNQHPLPPSLRSCHPFLFHPPSEAAPSFLPHPSPPRFPSTFSEWKRRETRLGGWYAGGGGEGVVKVGLRPSEAALFSFYYPQRSSPPNKRPNSLYYNELGRFVRGAAALGGW